MTHKERKRREFFSWLAALFVITLGLVFVTTPPVEYVGTVSELLKEVGTTLVFFGLLILLGAGLAFLSTDACPVRTKARGKIKRAKSRIATLKKKLAKEAKTAARADAAVKEAHELLRQNRNDLAAATNAVKTFNETSPEGEVIDLRVHSLRGVSV